MAQILVVGGVCDAKTQLAPGLHAQGWSVVEASSLPNAVRAATTSFVDALVVDANRFGGDAQALVACVAMEVGSPIPALFVDARRGLLTVMDVDGNTRCTAAPIKDLENALHDALGPLVPAEGGPADAMLVDAMRLCHWGPGEVF